jgi:hypothetical protein
MHPFSQKRMFIFSIILLCTVFCGEDLLNPPSGNNGTLFFYDAATFLKYINFWNAAEDRIELNIITVESSLDGNTWSIIYDDASGTGVLIYPHKGVRSTGVFLSGMEGSCKMLRITYDFAAFLGSDGVPQNLLTGNVASKSFIARSSNTVDLTSGIVLEIDMKTSQWLQINNGKATLTSDLGTQAQLH